jgi:hypothetical protein
MGPDDSFCGIPEIQTGASKASHDSLSSSLGPGKTFFKQETRCHSFIKPLGIRLFKMLIAWDG